MTEFWKREYDELFDYLNSRFGATWLLNVFDEIERNKKKQEGAASMVAGELGVE